MTIGNYFSVIGTPSHYWTPFTFNQSGEVKNSTLSSKEKIAVVAASAFVGLTSRSLFCIPAFFAFTAFCKWRSGFVVKKVPPHHVIPVVMGSFFLDFIAQISIKLPFTPIPITLQTLGVSLIAMSMGSQAAPLAVSCYLLQAAAGLPVLAGGKVDPLWLMGPGAGYLIGCLLSSYSTAKLLEHNREPKNFLKTWTILSANESTVLVIGTIWLSCFIGFSEAMTKGFFPFIPGALVKITIATLAQRYLDLQKK